MVFYTCWVQDHSGILQRNIWLKPLFHSRFSRNWQAGIKITYKFGLGVETKTFRLPSKDERYFLTGENYLSLREWPKMRPKNIGFLGENGWWIDEWFSSVFWYLIETKAMIAKGSFRVGELRHFFKLTAKPLRLIRLKYIKKVIELVSPGCLRISPGVIYPLLQLHLRQSPHCRK